MPELIEAAESAGSEPTDLCRLARCLDLATNGCRSEAQRELLADLAIAILDEVVGVRIDADQTSDFDVEAGFFVRFSDGGVLDTLYELVRPTGKRPVALVRSLDEQNLTVLVLDERNR